MIYVDNVTMNYRIQQENIKSIKEYLVNVLRGKISYKEFCALNQVNLHINRGEVCGIVGRNGAFTAGRRLMENSHISKTHTVISFLLRQSFQFTMQTVK